MAAATIDRPAIELTWYEVLSAALVGTCRQIEALKKGRPGQHGCDEEDGWTKHIEGAAGEMAFAKFSGRYWSASVNTFKRSGDVGKVQGRTRSKDHYDLLVRDEDADEDVFVLVTGQIPTFLIVGWLRGKDAKRNEWRQTYGDRPQAYFVPQDQLNGWRKRATHREKSQ